MLDVMLISLSGIFQLIVTWYAVHISVRHHRKRNAEVIGTVGLLAVILTGVAAYNANQDQEHLKEQLRGIKQELSGASVAMTFVGLNPPVQPVMPNAKVSMQMKVTVQSGTAKAMQCSFDMITLPGPPNAEQTRKAQTKFRETIASSDQSTVGDQSAGGGCYQDKSVALDERQLSEIVSRNGTVKRTIYGMAYATWKNEAGANFDTGLLCRWMEPPNEEYFKKTILLAGPAWHACAN
jgi:hypothetical protein